MNWMTALYNTYERCSRDPETLHDHVPLVPFCHTTVQVQLEIRIDGDSSFVGAEVVPKEQQTTIIPCIESSDGRTTNVVPHPLCDKLMYVSGDLPFFLDDKKGRSREAFDAYLKNLKRWCDSPYGNDTIRAVFEYVSKGKVMADLISTKAVVLNEDGSLATKSECPDAPLFSIAKISQGQDSAFVRWVVTSDRSEPRVWENVDLRESWISFYTQTMGNEGLCYMTGEIVPLAQNNPSKIRNAGDRAKILSSNDTSGFTFRGRFENAEQAFGIGYEATQKIHSALRWLIGRQGYQEGDLCIVTWTDDGDEVRSPVQDFSDFLQLDDERASTGENAALFLNKRIAGYNSKILDKNVNMMAIDSATPGRLSVVMFRRQLGTDFVERLESWHTKCAWIHTHAVREVEGKPVKFTFIGAPSPRDIAKTAYGEKADSKIIAHAVERILPCIIDGVPIPRDIVDCCVRRASNPVSMETWEWNKTLSIACSVFKCYKGGAYNMVLEKDRHSRDYLYGRLLAVADLLEGAALRDAGENRQTTAIRLMQRFSEFPYTTWKDIELALVPYKARLGSKANYYDSRISEIMDMFDGDEFRDNSKLSGEFLLAYHCQREEHFRKKDETNKVE